MCGSCRSMLVPLPSDSDEVVCDVLCRSFNLTETNARLRAAKMQRHCGSASRSPSALPRRRLLLRLKLAASIRSGPTLPEVWPSCRLRTSSLVPPTTSTTLQASMHTARTSTPTTTAPETQGSVRQGNGEVSIQCYLVVHPRNVIVVKGSKFTWALLPLYQKTTYILIQRK